MPRRETLATPILIMVCFAVVVLACGLKNYLSYLVSGTSLCPYLCPSAFGWGAIDDIPLVGAFFALQAEVQASLQALADNVWSDHWDLTTLILIAPLLEEAVYRGPLYLSRRWSHTPHWWIFGFLMALVFALSHGRSGLAMVPLIALGVSSQWLIAVTRRLWPSIALHVLHNFFFTSAILYQSLWVSD